MNERLNCLLAIALLLVCSLARGQVCSTSAQCGIALATYANDVHAYCNGDKQTTGFSCHGEQPDLYSTFGLEYQCAEYVKRLYATKLGIDTKTYCWQGDAITYSSISGDNVRRGLAVSRNKETPNRPQIDDIVVFKIPDGVDEEGNTVVNDKYGHVAIITGVTDVTPDAPGKVDIIEQNFSRYRATQSLVMTKEGDNYILKRPADEGSKYEVIAWTRLAMGPVAAHKNFALNAEVTLSDSDVGVRDKAAGLIRNTNPKGTKGKVVGGPSYSCGDWWWNVDFETGNNDGWVAEGFLKEIANLPPGSLDTSFGSAYGRVIMSAAFLDAPALAVTQDNGVVVGVSKLNGGALIKLKHNGDVDFSFGQAGVVDTTGDVLKVASDKQGRIVALESTPTGSVVSRYDASGNPDPVFGEGGRLSLAKGYVSITIDTQGRLVVAGSTHGLLDSDFRVTRLSSSGTIDSMFGTAGTVVVGIGSVNDEANALAIDSQGRIVVGGSTTSGFIPGSITSQFAVMRLLQDGQVDTGFGIEGKVVTDFGNSSYCDVFLCPRYRGRDTFAQVSVEGTAVMIDPSDQVVVAGRIASFPSGFALAKYLENGQPDPAFGDAGKAVALDWFGTNSVPAAVMDVSGRIVVGGQLGLEESLPVFALFRLLPTGRLDTSFRVNNPQAIDPWRGPVQAIAIDQDGRIVFSGTTNPYGYPAYRAHVGRVWP